METPVDVRTEEPVIGTGLTTLSTVGAMSGG